MKNTININKINPTSRGYIKDIAGMAGKYKIGAFLVGGAVRDAVMNKRLHDLDFTFDRIPLEFVEEFSAKFGVVVLEHPRFRTHSITLAGGEAIDFATFRSESYPVAADLPVVEPGSMVEDLFRRDFTINSMSVSLAGDSDWRIIDPYNGQRDIKDGVMRVMHCRSFLDDPTRIFRLARFMARFGFKKDISTDVSLELACRDKLVLRLTPARIKNEFIAIFKEKDPGVSLKLLDKWGVLSDVHPKLKFSKGMRFSTGRAGGFLNLAVLLQHWSLEDISVFTKRLQVSGRDRQRIIELVSLAGKMRRDMPLDHGDLKDIDFQMLGRMEGMTGTRLKQLKKKINIENMITGEDLKRMGFKPGPEFRRIFSFLSQAIENGRVHSKRDAEKLIFDNFTHQR